MSRSYKHNPVYTDGGAGGPKSSKRMANKKIRHLDFEELPLKGTSYKKYFCQYDIHDWKSRWTLEEAIAWWENNPEFYKCYKNLYRHWYKSQKAK